MTISADADPVADAHHPWWAWAAPLAAWLLLAIKFTGIASGSSPAMLVAAAVFLAGAVFASVHHAEIIAARVGEPFGSIVLAMAVTVIEVALIVSVMLSAAEGSEALARDTVFATVMIVLNGVVGLSLVVGGARYRAQSFQTQGSAAALSVIGTLAVIALVLPNYTLTVMGPFYAPVQMGLIGLFSMLLYGVFLFEQTIRHRQYFLVIEEPSSGSAAESVEHAAPSNRTTAVSLALLVTALTAVVVLAKLLAPALEEQVVAAHLPLSFVGVVIAAVVLLPEGIAAVRAARANRLQNSLTLALGSAMATIGLTIPVVAFTAIMLGQPLLLGLGPEETVLLLLTLFIGTVTLATGRTTLVQGAVHLVIFAIFLLLSILP
ncbi:calcium:proton antiporter [Dokdonella sp.]|uniref:calcium:proton antiporter n=1 Tax=Dokdonella sp. TaxID=2291710 RepID=UPI003C613A26